MSKTRTALIGCGKVGVIPARALSRLPQSNFVAACDSDPKRADLFAAEFKTSAYSDIQAMIRGSAIDAVCICTPHPLHAAAAIEAIESGAHALVEKPLASTLADCDTMIRTAARRNVEL